MGGVSHANQDGVPSPAVTLDIEAEHFVRALLDGFTAHVAVVDESGLIVAVNQAWRSFAERNGRPGRDDVGSNYFELCEKARGACSDEARPFLEGMRRVQSGELKFFDLEYPCHSPDQLRWFAAHVTCFPFAGHKLLLVTHDDITAFKQAEDALRESETRFRGMFASITEGMVLHKMVYDEVGQPKDYVVLEANEAFGRHTGFQRDAIIGKRATEAYAVPVAPCLALYAEVARTLQPVTFEEYFAGWSKTFRITAYAPRVGYFATVLVDITAQKEAEAALRESEYRLRTLIDTTPDIICFKDATGRWLLANQSILNLYGIRGVDYHGKSELELAEFTAPVYRKAFQQCTNSDEKAWATNGPSRGEEVIPSADGTLNVFDVIKVPLFHPNGQRRGLVVVGRNITERQRAEEALRKSELLLRESQDVARMGAWIVNPELNYVSWTEGVYSLLEVPRELRLNLEEALKFYLPAYIPLLKVALQRAMKDGTPFVIEAEVRATTGHIFWAEVRGLRRVEEGSHSYVMGTFQDITERKRADAELRVSEERLRALSDAAFEAVFISENGICLEQNLCAGKMFGYTMEEALGRPGTEWIAPEDRELVMRHIREGFEGLYEVTARRKDGTTFPCEIQGRMCAYKGRKVRVTALRDITQRKRDEEQLRLQSAMLQAAANGIIIADRSGKILWVNDAFTKLTGYSVAESIGRNPRVLKSGKHDEAFYGRMWETILAGEVWHGELVNKRKNGTLFTEEMTITPVRDMRGQVGHFIAIKQDVTARRELEDSLRQSQKMESIGRLAGGIAHDFNNILQTILGFSELLQAVTPVTDGRRGDLKEIHKAASRAAELTQQLLAFSRRQTLLPRVLDLNHMLADSEKMLRRLLGEDVQLVLQLAPKLHRTQADPGQITQIIMNLAINARDAMPNGGRLTMSTGNAEFDERDLSALPDAQPGYYVCLAVSDTGCGMSPEVQQHIFEPFYTTKSLGKGTGLGLAVIYGIVKQSNGWIHVYSQEGQGTTFKIYLRAQLVEGGKPAALRTQARVDAQSGHGERILLVEDEDGVRNLAHRVCVGAGYAVEACASLLEARQIWEREAGRFDLLFSDVVLTDGSGVELAAQILAQHPQLPVLLCSGYSDERSRWSAIAEKNHHFLQKPYSIGTLLEAIRQSLDGVKAQ